MPRDPERSVTARLRRLLAPDDEIDAASTRAASEKAGCDTICAITDRRKVSLRGYVSSMVLHPSSAPDTVEADLFDGTGTITLIWLGRRKIAGVRPGTRLSVTGFAAHRGARRVMYNPRYELVGEIDEESEEQG